MYRLTTTNAVVRLADLAIIPADARNQDYLAYLAWQAIGNTALPVDPPSAQESAAAASAQRDAIDSAAARSQVKLQALMAMTPAQVQVWVAANVTTLAQAQDAIGTLAIAVGVLARRL